ncbi:MAG: ABC transporter permease subunit [Treponema sp.]|nr:ABC transporter permease subunit [Treponema sp.]
MVNSPLILPFPVEVFRVLLLLCRMASFWQHIGATFMRCFVSFILSVVLGTGIGILCGISSFFKNYFSFPLEIIRATPVVSFILLALFWFTSSQVPVFVSVLMTLPVMATSTVQGFSKKNSSLEAMAHVYSFTGKQTFRWITLPSVLPFFLSGAVSSFGLTWKVVAAGEVLSLPAKGIGTIMQTAQIHLETADVAAATFVIVVLSFGLEKLFASMVTRNTKQAGDSAL